MEKYIIIGGGPSGLSLAYALSNQNYEITLYEKTNQLGGSWNSQWIENKYWSENSPRVLGYSGYTKLLLKEIGINEGDISSIYGNVIETNLKVLNFIRNYFSLKDYYLFIKMYIFYKINNSNHTLEYVLDNYNFTIFGKKTIKILSILVCDRPDKTNINDFIGSLSPVVLSQYKEPNKWHKNIEKILLKRNVTIIKNTEITGLTILNNKINFVKVQDTKIKCDKVFLCTQSSGIYNILKNSDTIIKNNWYNWKLMTKWLKETDYIGFGFQLHFDKIIEYPQKWCWSCIGDWTVIILPVSNWLKTISKDKKVKTVWSCCIVDMDTKSKQIGLTANECNTKNKVLKECINQINTLLVHNNIDKIVPYKITFSKGLYRDSNKNKWISQNTGFTRGKYNNLPLKGKINNLFALGCFSEKNFSNISYKETAILATVNYLNNYESNIISFHNRNYKQKIIIRILYYIIYSLVLFSFYNYIKNK